MIILSCQCATATATQLEVCFAPPIPGGCDPTETIIRIIAGAHRQILVQAYEFTSAPIAKAIVDAHMRGLDVRVILDKSNLHEGYSSVRFLTHEDVPVMIDAVHNIAHNKVMIVDGETVITGSFNFTKAAEERNAENLVVIHDRAIATTYIKNWDDHAGHSDAVRLSEDQQGNAVAQVPVTNGEVTGNKHSHIYAWPGCGSYDRMSPGNRVVFASRQAAEAAGFRAARNCR